MYQLINKLIMRRPRNLDIVRMKLDISNLNFTFLCEKYKDLRKIIK